MNRTSGFTRQYAEFYGKTLIDSPDEFRTSLGAGSYAALTGRYGDSLRGTLKALSTRGPR
jgi:hypothetical protein